MLLDWGIEKSNELDLEIWLNSGPTGKSLYEKNGFVALEKVTVRPETSEPDERWRQMERELLPITTWPMWRPRGGRYIEGKTAKPWACS